MTRYRLLENAPLGPAEIKLMTEAYEECLGILQLNDRSDPLRDRVAVHIAAIINTGERDPQNIAARAIQLIISKSVRFRPASRFLAQESEGW